MATDVLTRNTVVGVKKETTEGTYNAPLAADLIEVAEPPSVTAEIENLQREIVKGSIGVEKPLKGMRGGTIEMLVELRAAGVTSGLSDEPEITDILEAAFGSKHAPAANGTTATGSTSTTIVLGSGQGANWVVGDILLVQGEVRFVTSINTDTLTLNEALVGTPPGSGVTVFRGWTYRPTSTGHPSLSVSIWYDAATSGPQFRATGCRPESLAFSSFEVGQIPKLAITLQMMDHSDVSAQTAPALTSLETQLPPVVINGRVTHNDTVIPLGAVEFTLANTIAKQLDINASSGVVRMHVTKRVVTGTIDPFMEQADIALQTTWRDNTTRELFVVVGQKDSSGNFIQGTCAALYVPTMVFTEDGREDQDGVMKHSIGWQAHEAETGTGNDELYLAFV